VSGQEIEKGDNNRSLRIFIFVVIQISCFGFIVKLFRSEQLDDFGWRSKSLILFILIYAFVCMIREIKKAFLKKNLAQQRCGEGPEDSLRR
jgi:hypothetical protein